MSVVFTIRRVPIEVELELVPSQHFQTRHYSKKVPRHIPFVFENRFRWRTKEALLSLIPDMRCLRTTLFAAFRTSIKRKETLPNAGTLRYCHRSYGCVFSLLLSQRCIVVLTHNPYPALFCALLNQLEPLYHTHGEPILGVASHNIAQVVCFNVSKVRTSVTSLRGVDSHQFLVLQLSSASLELSFVWSFPKTWIRSNWAAGPTDTNGPRLARTF